MFSRDPRRPARGPGRRRVGAARARRARPGDDRPGRHLLRAAHDPGDARARRDDRRARARRLADQLHQPGRHGHRGGPAGARRPRGRHLRLARPGCAGASPARSATSPREMWFDYFGLNHLGWLRAAHDADGDRLPELLADDAALAGLRGGAPVRRRLAARARDDPERVPVLLLLRRRHGRVDPRAASAARRVPARVAGRVLRPERPGRRCARAGAPPAPSATAPTWPSRAARRRGRGRPRRRRRRRRLRGRGDGGRRGDRQQHPRDHDPQHRQPLRAAVPRRARRRRGALHRRPHRPGAGRVGAVPAARAGARHRDQGRRAHDDRGGADRLRRPRGPRARAAPAGPERQTARDIFAGYRAQLPELQERFAG